MAWSSLPRCSPSTGKESGPLDHVVLLDGWPESCPAAFTLPPCGFRSIYHHELWSNHLRRAWPWFSAAAVCDGLFVLQRRFFITTGRLDMVPCRGVVLALDPRLRLEWLRRETIYF